MLECFIISFSIFCFTFPVFKFAMVKRGRKVSTYNFFYGTTVDLQYCISSVQKICSVTNILYKIFFNHCKLLQDIEYSSLRMHVCSVMHVQLFVTPWTVAHQAPGILQARILEWIAISFSIIPCAI